MGKGFTLVEVIVSISILTIIMSLPLAFFWGIGRVDALSSATREVISIINEAQIDTVSGRSPDGNQTSSYGVHFEQDYFVRFTGTAYNANDSQNIRIDLPKGIKFSSISLPNNEVIFERVTGEVLGFNPTLNLLVLEDVNTNATRRIIISGTGQASYE